MSLRFRISVLFWLICSHTFLTSASQSWLNNTKKLVLVLFTSATYMQQGTALTQASDGLQTDLTIQNFHHRFPGIGPDAIEHLAALPESEWQATIFGDKRPVAQSNLEEVAIARSLREGEYGENVLKQEIGHIRTYFRQHFEMNLEDDQLTNLANKIYDAYIQRFPSKENLSLLALNHLKSLLLLRAAYVLYLNNIDTSAEYALNHLSRYRFEDVFPNIFSGDEGLESNHRDWPYRPRKEKVPSIDLAQMKLLQPVKNQGQCGSCWAYAITGSIESAWSVLHKTLGGALSEQDAISCIYIPGAVEGCNGADIESAIRGIADLPNGLLYEKDYPQTSNATGQTGACIADPKKKGIRITKEIKRFLTETQLANAMKNGTVILAIGANERFMVYKGGVLKSLPGDRLTGLNHGVQGVGFSSETSVFKGRNSWGERWGEDGYFRWQGGESWPGAFQVGKLGGFQPVLLDKNAVAILFSQEELTEASAMLNDGTEVGD